MIHDFHCVLPYIIETVNGTGNRSHEQYICIHDGCALCVMVEVNGFSSSTCISILVTASKEQRS